MRHGTERSRWFTLCAHLAYFAHCACEVDTSHALLGVRKLTLPHAKKRDDMSMKMVFKTVSCGRLCRHL